MTAHSLGPHVVGQRVVVRRVVPGETGPTGGPAFTDVLGVCTSWGDSSLVVQPESGDPVTIPLPLVVSGKPVPPRASPRLRVSVLDAELRTAALFPGLETERLGDWQLRRQPDPAPGERLRRRANSCLAIGEPGLPLDEALAAVRGFYAERRRDPLVNVELGSAVEESLRERGWEPIAGDAHFMLASLARVRRALSLTDDAEVEVEVAGSRARATVRHRAEGQAAVDGDWLGLFGLTVEPAYRRRGLARVVLSGLLEWGAEQGATTVWLHVETANEPAIALYRGLGFERHHTYRYLAPPRG